MYKALQSTFDIVINESDWKNLDLIIHYLTTGRADTIKEALYQVDRQRQTDQIVKAISIATEAMASHIENAYYKLGDGLARCFSRLNSNLQSMTREIVSAEKNSNSEIARKLDMQISEAKTNSILLAKSNQTTEELLHDLRYNQRFWVK